MMKNIPEKSITGIQNTIWWWTEVYNKWLL